MKCVAYKPLATTSEQRAWLSGLPGWRGQVLTVEAGRGLVKANGAVYVDGRPAGAVAPGVVRATDGRRKVYIRKGPRETPTRWYVGAAGGLSDRVGGGAEDGDS